MATLMGDVRVLVLAKAHSLLDAKLKANSPAVLKQYIRDLEAVRAGIASQLAQAGGDVTTLNREITEAETSKHGFEERIRVLLQSTDPNAPAIAKAKAVNVATLDETIKVKRQALADEQKLVSDLTLALSQIDAKHAEMLEKQRTVQTAVLSASAKNASAAALRSYGSLSTSGVNESVDNLVHEAQHTGDVADANFQQALSETHDNVSSELSDAADDVLARLKGEAQPVGAAK